MSLAEAFQNILFGPAPTSDNMGNQMADQLGEDNPYSIMLRRYRGVPTMNMINAATGYDLQNRGQKLSENQFDAQTYIPTQDMANGMTPDNNQGFIVTPGQRRYINDIQQAMTQQNTINERTKYNTAVDAAMKYLQGIPGMDPNNPAFLALNPDTRGMFTPEQVGNATLGMANTAYQAPQLKEQQQQMSGFYDQFVNSMIPEAQRQNFMLPNIKAYWLSHPEEFSKFVQQWTPQAPKPIDPWDVKLKEAQIAKYYHDAGAPYRGGGGGGEGKVSPQDKTFLGAMQDEYTAWKKALKDKGMVDDDRYSWTLDKYMRERHPSEYARWHQLTYGGGSQGQTASNQPTIVGKKFGYQKNGYYSENDWWNADGLVKKYGSFKTAWNQAKQSGNVGLQRALLDRYNMMNNSELSGDQLDQRLNKK